MAITLNEFIQELKTLILDVDVEVDEGIKELVDEGCPYIPAYKFLLYFKLNDNIYGEYFDVSSWLLSNSESVKDVAVQDLIRLIKKDWDYVKSRVVSAYEVKQGEP